MLLLLLHVGLDLLLGQLVVAMLVLALVLRVKEEMITLSSMDGSLFQILPKNSHLRPVMHIVSKKLLLWMQPLLTGSKCIQLLLVDCGLDNPVLLILALHNYL